MNKYLSLIVILFTTTLFAIDGTPFSFDVYTQVRSSYISSSGAVTDNKPCIWFGADGYYEINKNISIHLGVFGNYSTDTLDNYYKKDHCVNELDYFIGIYANWNNFTLSLDYERWTYPNLIGGKDEDVIHPNLYYSIKNFRFGLEQYIYIDDPYDFRWDLIPYIQYKIPLLELYGKSLTFTPKVAVDYRDKVSGNEGWCSFYYKLTFSWNNIDLFYQKWYQLDDKVYTDWNHDKCSDTFGIGYTYYF